MNEHIERLKEEAQRKAQQRKKEAEKKHEGNPWNEDDRIVKEVAEYLSISTDEVADCCGNICPHCETFLDVAIAREELGYKNHLFMNPTQEEMFDEALEIYRNDRKEFNLRKLELMDRMR